jgi:hypothetical protein
MMEPSTPFLVSLLGYNGSKSTTRTLESYCIAIIWSMEIKEIGELDFKYGSATKVRVNSSFTTQSFFPTVSWLDHFHDFSPSCEVPFSHDSFKAGQSPE